MVRQFFIVGLIFCGCLTGAVTLAGCGGDSHAPGASAITRDAPDTLYGTWRLVQVSGGISGGGYPIQAETLLTFDRSANTTQTENGITTVSGKYQVTRTTQSYGSPDKPVIDDFPTATGEGRAIIFCDMTHLTLSQAVADGFQFDYERVN